MKTKEIEFNAADLVRSAEAFANQLTRKQKLTRRTGTTLIPPRVKPLTPSRLTDSAAMACQRKNTR